MLSEKNFRKIMLALTIFIVAIVAISTINYYKKLPTLGAENQVKEEAVDTSAIDPFDAFSSSKEDLLIKFGEGKQGSGENYDNMYIDFNQDWFGEKVNARYYYGDYDRVYQLILKYKFNSGNKVFENMKKRLGEPLFDDFSNEDPYSQNMAFWIKGSVRYTIAKYESEDLCEVSMNLQYYSNPSKLDLGNRPIAIEYLSGVSIGDFEGKGDLILVGDKPDYFSRNYNKLFLVYEIGEYAGEGGEKVIYLGNFKPEYNGGHKPTITLNDIDKDGKQEAIVEAKNDYTTYYTVFDFENKDLNAISAGEKNPLTAEDITNLEEDTIVLNEGEKEASNANGNENSYLQEGENGN